MYQTFMFHLKNLYLPGVIKTVFCFHLEVWLFYFYINDYDSAQINFSIYLINWLSTISFPLNCNRKSGYVRNQVTIFVQVFFWDLYSFPFVCLSQLVVKPDCFDYWSFTLSLEIQQVYQIYFSSKLPWLF